MPCRVEIVVKILVFGFMMIFKTPVFIGVESGCSTSKTQKQ